MEKTDLETHPAVERLRAWNARAVEEVTPFRGEMTVVVPRELLRAAAERLRDDAVLQFNLLSDIIAVDFFPVEPRFELNYHLVSIPCRAKLRLRVRLPGENPAIESVTSVWPGADWMEREVFDLFGIRFEGHPNLRRILLPEDWEGYPLRRDYPVEGDR
jgi:NADH-quinone oxidoreductase subunit C